MSDSILAHIAQEANSLMLRSTDPAVTDLARLVRMLADATGLDDPDVPYGAIDDHESRLTALEDHKASVGALDMTNEEVDKLVERVDALERGTVLD